jgi:hypothetical protein
MDIFVRAPMFTPEGKPILDKRMRGFHSWWKDEIQSLRHDFKIQHDSFSPIIPGLHFQFSGGVRLRFPRNLNSLVPKGLCVRMELFSILDEIDHVDVRRRNDCYFVLIDGSGAFPYSNIRAILEKLSPDCPVVLGLRDSGGDWGMGPGRKQIELFEMSLLEAKYPREIRKHLQRDSLPDAQAGCWGLHLGCARFLALTARDYSLEFDVIASTLAAGLRFGYAPVTLSAQRTGSSFRAEDSLRKLKFIQHKLSFSEAEVRRRLKAYLASYQNVDERLIPPSYVDGVLATGPETWRRSPYDNFKKAGGTPEGN